MLFVSILNSQKLLTFKESESEYKEFGEKVN